MTPSQYKGRYENLSVTLETGKSEPIRINQYRLRGLAYDPAGNDAFLKKLAEKGVDIEIVVNTTTGQDRFDPRKNELIDGFKDWATLARYAFLGKGSPEACQIVLQLVKHWQLDQKAGSLQSYADKYLGLDCNGFVGNYLWHDWGSRPWTDLGVGNHDKGPDVGISGYLDPPRKLVSKWDEIDTSKSYILGKVDGSGRIIDGGKLSNIGHVAITEPGFRAERSFKNGSKTFGLRVVESTGSHTPGIWESWYWLRHPEQTSPKDRVFQIDREDMNGLHGRRYVSFKIAALNS